MAPDSSDRRERQISRDEAVIREWASDHDAVPVRERRPGSERDDFRLVPRSRVDDDDRVDWDTFFSELEEGDHVVVYEGETADEPFLVSERDEVVTRADDDIEEQLLQGETVTTEVTETRVVESVVVEEVTIDSELVDSQVVDHDVVDVELVDREVSNCDIVADQTDDASDWFDAERYVGTLGDRLAGRERTETTATFEGDVPYHAEFDVDERWRVTMDLVERFDVESRIADADVAEVDTIQDHDIDVGGLHRSIVESGIVDVEHSTDEVMTSYDIESELAGSEEIHTSFTRTRRVEDDVLDRKHLEAEIASGQLLGMETVSSTEVEGGAVTNGEGGAVSGGSERTDDEAANERATTGVESSDDRGPAESETAAPTTLDDDAVGKTVVDASGTEIGIVTDVQNDGDSIAVDTHPSITDRIRTTLGWGEADGGDYTLDADKIDRVQGDRIRLKSEEHLGETDRDR